MNQSKSCRSEVHGERERKETKEGPERQGTLKVSTEKQAVLLHLIKDTLCSSHVEAALNS